MVQHTEQEEIVHLSAVSPSRKDVNAIVEANHILEITPEIRGTHHALSVIAMLPYSREWSLKDLTIAQVALSAYRNVANLESSQEYWEKELFPLAENGDQDYPYELINTMMFERINQTIILDHAYDIVTRMLEKLD